MERHVFRIWDKRRGKMSEHFDIWSIDRDDSFNTYIPGLGKVYESDAVLMQCTGLRDKNGQLVFDGDIVRDTFIMTIGATFTERNELRTQRPFEIKIPDFYYSQEFMGYSSEDLEIIGNVYENPELLGAK